MPQTLLGGMTNETQRAIMRMRTLRRKMADHTFDFQRSSVGSLQRTRFRKTTTNILTSVARAEYVTVFSGRTYAP